MRVVPEIVFLIMFGKKGEEKKARLDRDVYVNMYYSRIREM